MAKSASQMSHFSPYKIEENGYRKVSIVSAILRAHNQPIKGTKSEYPLSINFGGATGVGKTVLSTLYSKELGICYDVVELVKESGANIDINKLRYVLNLGLDESVCVLTIPKFTTRKPRTSEMHGIEFYFVEPSDLEGLRKHLLFTYNYDGNSYGIPKSITWPLKHGIDSITAMTGYESFSKMSEIFPESVGMWVDAYPRDIEAHIKGRSASEQERQSRLSAFVKDREDFYRHRHEISYSVFIDSLKSLRTDMTKDRERLVMQELDNPFRQVKAIVRWERYLRRNGVRTEGDPQRTFDYFLDHVTKVLFNGISYEEVKDRLGKNENVPIIDNDKDAELLKKYSEAKGITRTLLEDIASRIHVNAVVDARGRRTIVLSPYTRDYITSIGGTEKRVLVELVTDKLNGFGTSIVNDLPGLYKPFSLLSGLKFSYGIDEAIFIYLTSDHIPVTELDKPRALNIVFSPAPEPQTAKSSIRELTLDEIVHIDTELAHDDIERNIFLRATTRTN